MQIGERLKEARLEKGLSLDDVQQMTKIQTRHLQAIEKGEFSLIPGSFYVRAFIKEYAQVVGLNPDELLAEHRGEVPKPEQENAVEYSRMQRTRGKTSSSKTSPFAALLPTIFVVILITGVLFFIWRIAWNPDPDSSDPVEVDRSAGDQVSLPPETEDQPSSDADEDNEQSERDQEDQDEGDEEPEQVNPTLSLDSYQNNQSVYLLKTDDDEIEMTIETTDSNWLEVETNTGESLYYNTLQLSQSPQTFTISDYPYVYLRFGNPGAISISINDLELELSEEIAPTAVQQLWLYINSEPDQ
ncbi:helix-turn-helix domain-containing protein [Amphibacillus sediminis]|uniref:helix-turn-helix domain-containing protein n=1 Tax=Amphibacillus sediminis TaxID=360185 RepID=UPI0008345D33|nr:RodZ domain-containing protein [Amphibacillus sediminis]